MKSKKNVIKITLLLSMLTLCFSSSAEDQAWDIKSRAVPLPAGASEKLRQSIASTAVPDPSAARRMFTDEEKINWGEMIKANSSCRGVSALKRAESLGVSIKKHKIEGITIYHVDPVKVDPRFSASIFLYVHGGAYVFGGGDSSVSEAAVIASTSKIRVISVDYRMPPTAPFPAAVDDVVVVYKHLLDEKKAAKSIAIGGTSAGGGLALAAVHKFRALGLQLPGVIYAGTPWADLTKTGDTLYTNEGLDRVLVTYDGLLGAAARLYANGHDMKDPLISPVYGNFNGFPATYLVTGTRDMFLSDTARTHRKLRAAGVVADLNVYEGLSHAGYAFNPTSPESIQVYSEMRDFLSTHLN
jgi:epsilon-lactone hydrolase